MRFRAFRFFAHVVTPPLLPAAKLAVVSCRQATWTNPHSANFYMTAQQIADQYAAISANRDKLRAKANAHSARGSTLAAERRAHLIAGEDAKASALQSKIQSAAEEQAALEDAIAELVRDLSALAVQQHAAIAAEERETATAGLVDATKRFLDARNAIELNVAAHAVEIRRLLNDLRHRHDAGDKARKRLNAATGVPGNWPAELWQEEMNGLVQIVDQLDRYNRRADPIRAAFSIPK
jgi:DNA repair exonuclease SbcCD ATPase subunit